jgi:hypothetical protein
MCCEGLREVIVMVTVLRVGEKFCSQDCREFCFEFVKSRDIDFGESDSKICIVK